MKKPNFSHLYLSRYDGIFNYSVISKGERVKITLLQYAHYQEAITFLDQYKLHLPYI